MKTISSALSPKHGSILTRAMFILALLLSSLPALSHALDETEFIGAFKFNRFIQSGVLTPPQHETFAFESTVEALVGTSINNVTLSIPNGRSLTLSEESEDDSRNWHEFTEFPDAASRDSAFPDGNYTFSLETGTGNHSLSLNLSGAGFPPAPRTANYRAAQAINASTNFTILWDPYSTAGPDDFIVLMIEDPENDGETLFESDFLPPNTSSISIPAGTLSPNRVYDAILLFARITDKNESFLPDGTAIAGFISETAFHIQTASNLPPGTGIERFFVAQLNEFLQSDSSAPQPVASSRNEGGVFIETSRTDALTGGYVSWPDHKAYPLFQDSNYSWYLNEEAFDRDPSDLLPDGTYRFHLESPDGTRIVPLILEGGSFPSAPRFTNFNNARQIDPAAPFTLTWNPFPNATSSDLVIIEIEASSRNEEDIIPLTFFPGNQTSIQIPAGKLRPGRNYNALVTFVKVLDSNTSAFSGSLGFAAKASGTTMRLKTISTAGPTSEVREINLFKTARHHQTGSGNPKASTEHDAFELTAEIRFPKSKAPDDVTLLTPAIRSWNLWDYQTESEAVFSIREQFSSLAWLNSDFPGGTYFFEILEPETGFSILVPLSGSGWPEPLKVIDFNSTQAIDSASAFTLSWNSSSTASDIISINIDDGGHSRYSSGMLPGNTTSVTIPAGSLLPDNTYRASLLVARISETGNPDFPDARITSGLISETILEIKTADGYDLWASSLPENQRGKLDDPGGHGINNLLRYAFGMEPLHPNLANLPKTSTINSDWSIGTDYLSLQFRLRNDPNLRYVVEASTDLLHWHEITPTDHAWFLTGNLQEHRIIDSEPISAHTKRFLRIRILE